MRSSVRLRIIKRIHRRLYTRFDISLIWEPWSTLEGPVDRQHDIDAQVSRVTDWHESFPTFEPTFPKTERTEKDIEELHARLDTPLFEGDLDFELLLEKLRKERIRRAALLIRQQMMY